MKRLSKPQLETGIVLKEVAAPGTPAAGYAELYVKSDGKPYIKDDAGTETALSGSTGGSLPSQTGSARKYLRTDGASASWGSPSPVSTLTVAASDSSAEDKAKADYVCDGTADDVEINAALSAFGTAGGRVLLAPGTFTLAATIAVTGSNGPGDSPKITVTGAGPDSTTVAPASGIHAFTITAQPKFEVSNLRISLAGSSDGIRATAGTAGDKRGFWMSEVHNVKFQGDNSTHSGWAMNLENPFRSHFRNLQVLNAKNGFWLKSTYSAFNPGNLVFIDCHVDLGLANGTAYFLDTADAGGFFNICTFIECDCIDSNSGSTTSIGWRFKGSTTTYFTTRDILVLRSNVELFNTAVSIEHSANIEFNSNYMDAKTGGTLFNVSADSPNNQLSVQYAYVPSPKTVKVLNDLNTDAAKPTTLRNSFARVETGGTLTMTKTTATVLSGLYRDTDGSGVYPTEWQGQTTALVVKDEGIELFRGTRSLNFTGAGVTTTNTSGDVTVTIPGGGVSDGDVSGPASSGDNAVVRFDGTTGKAVQSSGAKLDDDASLTLTDPSAPILDEDPARAALNFTHTNGTGTSNYRVSQDSYDILNIKRTGDTTGDGDAWSIVNIVSPSAAEAADNEATLSLTTFAGAPGGKARTLDVYSDDYSRDHGMGMRQLYKNTTPNPIRFELHDKTTGNGRFTLNECYAYVGNFYVDYVTADITGVTPSVDDWIWDNGLTYLPDDTKITSVEADTPSAGSTRLHINRAVLATGEGVALRGINVKEIMRLTADRQLLVRKFIPDSSTSVAEFGGPVVLDGTVTIKGGSPGSGKVLTSDANGLASWQTPSGGGTDDQTAAEVPFTPTGNVAATDVQAAIAELDSEKQPLDADLTTIAGLADPNADRILFWDDSAGLYAYLAPSSSISISGTTINTVQNIRTTDVVQFARLGIGTAADASAQLKIGTTMTGLLKATSGVVSAATAGTDFYAPAGTDVAVTDGGTGASDAAAARTNLGLGSAATMAGPSGTIVGTTDTQILTGKDVKSSSNTFAEVTTTTTSATPTPTGGSRENELYLTALAENATIGAPSGTPSNGNKLVIRIKDNGGVRTLAWNAIYRAIGVTLPTSTTASKTLYVGARYNSSDSKWDVLGVSQEA